jgi:uncharacterized protein (DUF1501 family)
MLHRRDVLKVVGAGAVLLPLGPNVWAAATQPGDKRLVVVFLRGAVDGLSVLVPYDDRDYRAARPTIALARGGSGGVIRLDARFGLHPALAPLMPLWQAGSLAFVPASGSPDPTRSHFDAQLIMEGGTARAAGPSGWLNRLLAVLPAPVTGPRGVSFGASLPHIMSGPAAVATVDARPDAEPLPVDKPEVAAAFDRLYGGDDALSRAWREGEAARREVAAAMAGDSAMATEQAVANNGAPLAEQATAQARRLGRLLADEPHFQVAFMAVGGWDTHVHQGNEAGQLARRLGYLADGLTGLVAGLGDQYRNTVILVLSEFGRTVRENGNGGTDHGHGNVFWVLGGPVRGGRIYGDWPGLAPERLYQNRDVAVTTDYRSLVGAVLHRHLGLGGAALARVLPQAPRGGAGLDRLIRTS